MFKDHFSTVVVSKKIEKVRVADHAARSPAHNRGKAIHQMSEKKSSDLTAFISISSLFPFPQKNYHWYP